MSAIEEKKKKKERRVSLSSSDEEEELVQEKKEKASTIMEELTDDDELLEDEEDMEEFEDMEEEDDFYEEEEEEENENYRVARLKDKNIFLAKWPNADISILTASNMEEAAYILDEIADPGQAHIVPYNGFLFLDLKRKQELFQRHVNYLREYKSKIKEQIEDKYSFQYQFNEWRKEGKNFDCFLRVNLPKNNKKEGSSSSLLEKRLFIDIPCHKAVFSLYNLTKFHTLLNEQTALLIIEFLYSGECFKTNYYEFKNLDENQLKNCLILSKKLEILELEKYITSIYISMNSNKKSNLQFAENNTPKQQYWTWAADICNFADETNLNYLFSFYCDQIKFADKSEEEINLIKQYGLKAKTLEKLNKWDKKKDSYIFDKKVLNSISFGAEDYKLGRSCSDDGYSLWSTINKSFYPHSYKTNNNRNKNMERFKENIIKDDLEHIERIEKKENDMKDHPFADIMKKADITDVDVFMKLIGM
ncbi:hypothetical protein ABK040_009649 [Willaertia magna]